MQCSFAKYLPVIITLGTLPLQAQKVYQEAGGYVMMEMENTESSLGEWVKKTTEEGYSGSGHLEFTGNSPSSGPVGTSLIYRFTINTAGNYRLHLRAIKRLDGAANDHCNDAYVKMEGDYTSGGNAPLSWLQNHTKLFGGLEKSWGWASMLDKNHDKEPPIYAFKAGQTYTLTISGRSQRFNIDRIVLCIGSAETTAKAATTESSTGSGGTPPPPPPPQTKINNGPAEGAEVIEGQKYSFAGEGENLKWYWDANSDGLGEFEFGTGTAAELTVPTGVNSPRTIWVELRGAGGTVRRSFTIANSVGGVRVYTVHPHNAVNNGGDAVYSLDGSMLHAGSGLAKIATTGVYLVKTRHGIQRHLSVMQ